MTVFTKAESFSCTVFDRLSLDRTGGICRVPARINTFDERQLQRLKWFLLFVQPFISIGITFKIIHKKLDFLIVWKPAERKPSFGCQIDSMLKAQNTFPTQQSYSLQYICCIITNDCWLIQSPLCGTLLQFTSQIFGSVPLLQFIGL